LGQSHRAKKKGNRNAHVFGRTFVVDARDGTAVSAVYTERRAIFQPEHRYLRWITAARGTDICIVTTDEVCYFKARDKYTIVVTETVEALIRKPLKALIAQLDPSIFWQIHRSTVVNAHAIAGVTRDFRGHLMVKLKQRAEVLAVAESCNRLFRRM
jgi:DNA-binding LytR/AlgR family response regulator